VHVAERHRSEAMPRIEPTDDRNDLMAREQSKDRVERLVGVHHR
jgi:hypothetical protein